MVFMTGVALPLISREFGIGSAGNGLIGAASLLGFAAAFGKIGAVTTAFLFPILLASIGTTALLYILVVTSILGAVITWSFRIETTGVNLAEIGRGAEIRNARSDQDLSKSAAP